MIRRTLLACLMALSVSGALVARADDDSADSTKPDHVQAGKRAALTFKRVDTDHDGSISMAEFESAVSKVSQRRGKGTGARGERLFTKLDTDGNGSLSPSEFEKLQSMRQRAGTGGRRKGAV
jgi:hypothetical protein